MFTLPAEALPRFEALIVFMALILSWATMRPSMLRDYDNRRLPNNPTARVLFVVICLFTYVTLVLCFQSFGEFARKISSLIFPAFIHNFVDTFRDQAPLLGAVTLGALLQFSFFRDLERSLLVWLHSARHLHRDSINLSKHLERCRFLPDADEREKNRETARRFGVYLLDEGTNGVGLVTFHNWRKVASLLRLVHEWNSQESRVLSQSEMTSLEEMRTAHERKTQLAMTIVKMVEQVDRGDSPPVSGLNDLVNMLSNTPHINRASVDAVEATVKSALEGNAAKVIERPLRLSGEAFHGYLQQIEGYFKVEYEILLNHIAALTAKSVVLSGDPAQERLQQLKRLGFAGLGRIEPINFDRILWMFLVVALGGFLAIFIGNFGNSAMPVDRMARFALVMAIAALIGAVVGSRRRHARAENTPWGIYFTAGILAAGIHITINEIWELARGYMQAAHLIAPNATALAAAAGPPHGLRVLPWAFLPFVVTIAVCRLARLERWPGIDGQREWHPIAERTLDGIAVSAAVLVAFYLAIATLNLLGFPIPPAIQAFLQSPHILPLPIMAPLQVLGFLIGFFTVRDVRRAAQANMIEVTPQAEPVAEAPVGGAKPLATPTAPTASVRPPALAGAEPEQSSEPALECPSASPIPTPQSAPLPPSASVPATGTGGTFVMPALVDRLHQNVSLHAKP